MKTIQQLKGGMVRWWGMLLCLVIISPRVSDIVSSIVRETSSP